MPCHLHPGLHGQGQHLGVALQARDIVDDLRPSVDRRAGFLRATEAETGKEFVSLGRQVWLDQDALETGLRRGGIDHLVIRTDEPFAHKLRHYFVSRNLFGRGAR